METKLVVVADDFTGSNDTGVQFSKKNLNTIVVTNSERIESVKNNCDILAVDTESRFDSPEIAYTKTFEIGNILNRNKIKYIYKKIDSTFRGNIGKEISGLMDGAGAKIAVVAASYPKAGRKIINGNVYVDNQLLKDTFFANDPKTPIKHSYVPSIIMEQCNKKVGLIKQDEYNSRRDKLMLKINELIKNNYEILVIDASTDDDLRTISDTIAEIEEKIVMVGSAGLAEYIPNSYNLVKKDKNVLIMAGSVNTRTIEQVDFLKDYDNIKIIKINLAKVFTKNNIDEIKRIKELCELYFKEENTVVIRSIEKKEDVIEAIGIAQKEGLTKYQASEKIALFMGKISAELLKDIDVDSMVLTGGDIAIKIANALDISGTLIIDEILPGIPYGKFMDEEYNNITVVTKAGGFGEKDSLKRVLEFILEDEND